MIDFFSFNGGFFKRRLTTIAARSAGFFFSVLIAVTVFSSSLFAQDRTMMQGFYWDSHPGGVWYDTLAYYSDVLGRAGFNSVWFPPPSKGAAGPFDVGYTPYDYYDLGEFDSAPGDRTSGLGNFIPTRYGTREGLQHAIQRFQENGMKVYADIVLNHRSGGNLEPNPYGHWYTDRNGGSLFSPGGDSTFTAFPLTHGSGRIAWPIGEGGQYFFPNAVRNPDNTADFFSGSQLDGFHQMYVNSFGYDNALHDGDGSNLPLGDSLMVWGEWLVEEVGFDGFRFDFVKGIHPDYLRRFMSQPATSDIFHVHELFDGSIDRLKTYLNQISGSPRQGKIFDFNMRFAYKAMSDGGDAYDIRNWLSSGLYNHGVPYDQIVTFVDNHDFDRMDYRGEINQEGHAPVVNNKMLAYAHMLTHPGYAQVWWRDYFHYGLRDEINRLVQIRSQFASGMHRVPSAYTDTGGDFERPFWPGNPEEDPRHVYVAERVGTGGQAGLVVAINKHSSFNIDVWVTVKPWAGRWLYDITGNIADSTQVFEDGRVLLRTQPSSYAVFVPTDYVLDEDINLELTSIDSPGSSYFVGDEVSPSVRLTNLSTFSQRNVPVLFQLLFDDELVFSDTVTVDRIEAGDQIPVNFPAYTFSEVGEYEVLARINYALDQDPSDDLQMRTVTVADTLGAWPWRIDGVASESQYRTMAVRQNSNSGFGPEKTVGSIRFADVSDSLFIFVEGQIRLNEGDGIGLFLDFSELDGAPAGTPLGGVTGGAFFLNTEDTAQDDFRMDFEVDYGFALFGASGGRAVLNIADYTGDTPVGAFVTAPTASPTGNGISSQGPSDSSVFPEGSIRYAFSASGEQRHGLEIAITREALGGVQGGQVRGFAFIVSSTAYFSNVLVPGDANGDADAFNNFGFNTDFGAIAEGGPFHSPWLAVNSSEAEPTPGITELGSPEDGDEALPLRPVLTWFTTSGAAFYDVQIALPDTTASKTRNHHATTTAFGSEIVAFAEALTDTSFRPVTPLQPETRYLWRVRSGNSSGYGPWSATREFSTGPEIPAPTLAPVLLLPSDDAEGIILPAELSWESVTNAEDYEVQVSITRQFFAFAARGFVSETSFAAENLQDNRRYFWRVRARNASGNGPWSETWAFRSAADVSVDGMDSDMPTVLALHQNQPNPFNPTTSIRYEIPAGADAGVPVRLAVYDILGRQVALLVNESVAPGRYTARFDATALSTGVYLYRIQMGGEVITRKMTVIK